MGSSMLVSRKLHHHHHHLIRHACAYAYACRRNLLSTSCVDEIERERERESERERQYLVQLYCKRSRSPYFTSLSISSGRSWDHPRSTFVAPHFGKWGELTGECHGVLHFAGHTSLVQGKDLLWMPSTNQFKILPPSNVPRLPSPSPSPRSVRIDFRPIGFGYDSKSQDYKVVRYVFYWYDIGLDEYEYEHIGDTQIELYSLKTDSWKEITELPIRNGSSGCTRILVNGRYYWCMIQFEFRRVKLNISSFDFTTEEFSWLAPPHQTTFRQGCKLVEVDGKLGIMIYDLNEEHYSKWGLELFVLDDNDNDDGIVSWTRVFKILNLVGVRHPVLYDSDAHLLFIEGDDVEDLWVYDIYTQELKKIGLSDQFLDISPYVVTPVAGDSFW